MSEIHFGAQEKFVVAHKRNSFWRTRYWYVLRPFLLGLQYSQGQKSAQTEKYGSIKGPNLMNLCPVDEEDTNLYAPIFI
jgi:hypothetical protein